MRCSPLAALLWLLGSPAALAAEPRTASTRSDRTPQPESVRVEVAPPAEASKPTSDEGLDARVQILDERVNELKEKVFRSKARLQSLQERVIGGDITLGAKAVIVHRNEMGASFVLEAATFLIDGAPVFTRVDQGGELDRRQELEVFAGRLAPGLHQLGVQLTYRGHGYARFKDLEGYRFRVQSSHTFEAVAGKVTSVRVVGFEQGGVGAELKDRPAFRYELDVQPEAPRKPAAAPRAAADGAPAAGGAAR